MLFKLEGKGPSLKFSKFHYVTVWWDFSCQMPAWEPEIFAEVWRLALLEDRVFQFLNISRTQTDRSSHETTNSSDQPEVEGKWCPCISQGKVLLVNFGIKVHSLHTPSGQTHSRNGDGRPFTCQNPILSVVSICIWHMHDNFVFKIQFRGIAPDELLKSSRFQHSTDPNSSWMGWRICR